MLIEFRVVVAVDEHPACVQRITRQMSTALETMDCVRQASIESILTPKVRLEQMDEVLELPVSVTAEAV